MEATRVARGRAPRSPERGPKTAPAPEPETAAEDLLIERPDLGPGAHTLIAAGDPVPPGLEGLPRRPRAKGAKR
jgi:hypothetical protein